MNQKVLSASRRTDIPAFYLDWFFQCLERREFQIHNPYNNRRRCVRFKAGEIHSIVFWSKNFAPLLSGRKRLEEYNLFFNFTVNAENKLLEPGVPPLQEKLEQAAELARTYSPESIHWRFDPIVFWEAGGKRHNNLSAFPLLAEEMARLGIKRCYISFMDRYAKIDRREKKRSGFRFIYPSIDEMVDITWKLLENASRFDLDLYTCCEKILFDRIHDPRLHQGHCIDVPLLKKIFGGTLKVEPDCGQRRSAGCGCYRAIDIGSYQDHPCLHSCLYCYANPGTAFPKQSP